MSRPSARVEERLNARMDEMVNCERCLTQMKREEGALCIACREFRKSEAVLKSRISALRFQNECDSAA